MTCKESEKKDKRRANRALRVAVRSALSHDDMIIPVIEDVSNVWLMAKDGKVYNPRKTKEAIKALRK